MPKDTDKLNVGQTLKALIEYELEQSLALQEARCRNGAPFIFFIDANGRNRLIQGCCNSWECPRCGQIRARHEYGRIVQGARDLSEQGHTLFFVTLTCRGRDIPLVEAEQSYYKWTNHLLTALRSDAQKAGTYWAYAGVTERQQRGHPHSHIITTYSPQDGKKTWVQRGDKTREVIVSARFAILNERAGLGNQHEITEIRDAIAVAVYVSKYLFKESMSTHWPRKWKRIRYSRNWPKLPEHAATVAFPIIKRADWERLRAYHQTIYCDSQVTFERALSMAVYNVSV